MLSNKLIDSHEYNYDISTPISNSMLKSSSPFTAEFLDSKKNKHQSREDLRNNVIMEDEKEVNYSTSNHSTNRKSDDSRERSEHNERLVTEPAQLPNGKEKSFSKDLINQMKEKIRNKQRNKKFGDGEMSKILVLGTSKIEESYKNTEYNDFRADHHNVTSMNSKQSK